MVTQVMQPPFFDSIDSYGARLGDLQYWRPYAEAALDRSGLSVRTLAVGFEGTYPTLVGDQLVVKLFGYFPGWRESWVAELAANRAIEDVDEISAPQIVADGLLFPGDDADWPFLIMQRLDGLPWREAAVTPETADSLARHLGIQIRRLHDLGSAELQLGRQDWIGVHGQAAAGRQRNWGSLPTFLIDQIPDYLRTYEAGPRCLVHGDLTEDHLFIREGELLGIIDWGDAMVTDPFYELGALHLGAFAGDRRLLGQFLRGYGWRVDQGFADHALQVALMHEFDLFASICDLTTGFETLTALAKGLWTPIF
jgi:hypothetical protein